MKTGPNENELSRRERQLLDALYRLGRATAAEIREAVADPPTYTAVRTHLTNLVEKGFVRFDSVGAKYVYEPVVPKEDMAATVMDGVLATFFQNRVELVVSTLLGRRDLNIDQAQLDRIAEIIEDARKEGR
jgi:predicted transcriptional regulator